MPLKKSETTKLLIIKYRPCDNCGRPMTCHHEMCDQHPSYSTLMKTRPIKN
jgi:hypothetical protein